MVTTAIGNIPYEIHPKAQRISCFIKIIVIYNFLKYFLFKKAIVIYVMF